MGLTKEEYQHYVQVLKDTGAHREAGKIEKVLPDYYLDYANKVKREKVTVEVPSVKVPVCCYITTALDKEENCPVHVNMHGGGFVYLQDEDDDRYCARIAVEIRGIVVDIDYASSYDHPYPVAFEQSYEVLKWTFAHAVEWGADPAKISMGGHSAGGCLVAACAFRAAKTGDFQVNLMILDYAANDNYFVTQPPVQIRSDAFSMLYADGDVELLKDPYVSPCFAEGEILKNLPKTVFVTPENCPFAEKNDELAMRMIKAGVEVTVKHYPACRHGFTVRICDAWDDAQRFIIKEIRDANA